MRKQLLLLFICILPRLYADFTLYVPERAVPGGVIPVLISAESDEVASCSLSAGDKVLTSCNAVLLVDAGPENEKRIYLALLGVPNTVKPGSALISVTADSGKGDEKQNTASANILIDTREFVKETIPLNSKLTGVRTANREVRRREAAELSEMLKTFRSEALYSNREFVFPLVTEKWWPSSFYGDIRTYVYADDSKAYSRHQGLDYAADKGTPVLASANGRIMMARNRQVTGNTVVLEIWPGVYLLYFHMNVMEVAEGDEVTAGQEIGKVGSTGLATGDHLHWEMRVNNIPVDPEVFLQKMLIDKDQLMSMIEGLL